MTITPDYRRMMGVYPVLWTPPPIVPKTLTEILTHALRFAQTSLPNPFRKCLPDPGEPFREALRELYPKLKKLHQLLYWLKRAETRYDYEYSKLRKAYMRKDFCLAHLDGRYQVVEPKYDKIVRKPKKNNPREMIKKLSPEQKQALLAELLENV